MISTLESFYYNEPRDINVVLEKDLYKIKTTQTDPNPGFLYDKIDNQTLVVNAKNQIEVNVDAILHNITWDKLSISGELDFYSSKLTNIQEIECVSINSDSIQSGSIQVVNLESTGQMSCNILQAYKVKSDVLESTSGEFQKLFATDCEFSSVTTDSLNSKGIVTNTIQTTNSDVLGTLNAKKIVVDVNLKTSQANITTANISEVNADKGFFNSLNVDLLTVKRFNVGSTISDEVKSVVGRFDTVYITGDLNGNNAYFLGQVFVESLRVNNIASNEIKFIPGTSDVAKAKLDFQKAELVFNHTSIYTENGIVFTIRETDNIKVKYEDITGTRDILTINNDGTIVISGTLVEASDERFKTNIKPVENILDKIMQLNPVSYKKINSNQFEYGFIAQEIRKVFPEIVYEDKEGYLHINYISLIPLLVKAIQELALQR